MVVGDEANRQSRSKAIPVMLLEGEYEVDDAKGCDVLSFIGDVVLGQSFHGAVGIIRSFAIIEGDEGMIRKLSGFEDVVVPESAEVELWEGKFGQGDVVIVSAWALQGKEGVDGDRRVIVVVVFEQAAGRGHFREGGAWICEEATRR